MADERPWFHPETRAHWRAWLVEQHATSTGVWVLRWRQAAGRSGPDYVDLVEEALCFGWVDSRPGKVDDERTRLLFTPRKPGSAWARTNKERVERLTAAGLMAPAGLAAVEAARASGSWELLDEVERLTVPDDLAAALDAAPPAREYWDAFPPSARRGILEWIAQAKRPVTRRTRVLETASLAQRNIRANQWVPPAARGASTSG